MRDIQKVLELWGAWAASDSSNIDYSHIAAGFKGLFPQVNKNRISCSDDDALIIESCLAKLKKRRPNEYSLLVAHYVYSISKRKIAKHRKRDEKLIRIEMQMAEGFVDGCLSMSGATLSFEC